jgi:hypothetical protein
VSGGLFEKEKTVIILTKNATPTRTNNEINNYPVRFEKYTPTCITIN